jgi:hypothetical protein
LEEFMAKEQGPVPTEPLSVTINAQTGWYLDRLIEKGLYGNSRQDAIRVVVYDHCKLLIAQGTLNEAPALAGAAALPVGHP